MQSWSDVVLSPYMEQCHTMYSIVIEARLVIKSNHDHMQAAL